MLAFWAVLIALMLEVSPALAQWDRHYVQGAQDMENAIKYCDDMSCFNDEMLRACKHWRRAEREARGLPMHEPLMALDAACRSLKIELNAGIGLDWHHWIDDMIDAVEELSHFL